jgi:inner membrane protein
MDPLVQGLAGGIVALAIRPKENKRFVSFVTGTLAGLAPDLDILIQSTHYPLMEVEYHRHFTHSLAFIPVGAALISVFCQKFLFRKHSTLSFKDFYLWAFLGYATHGVIDACTSYGTQLLWPFSDARVAWNNVAIVDPIVTLCLAIGCWGALKSRSKNLYWARGGILAMIFYLLIGVVQRDRALNLAVKLAEKRGHQIQRITVKPTVLNNVLFRSLYEYDGKYFVDGIRVGWFGSQNIYPGIEVTKLDIARDFPWLSPESQQFKDLQKYSWFSDGYIFQNPHRPGWVGDLRFALLPNERDSLWYLILDQNAASDQHADFKHQRSMTPEKPGVLWSQMWGSL